MCVKNLQTCMKNKDSHEEDYFEVESAQIVENMALAFDKCCYSHQALVRLCLAEFSEEQVV